MISSITATCGVTKTNCTGDIDCSEGFSILRGDIKNFNNYLARVDYRLVDIGSAYKGISYLELEFSCHGSLCTTDPSDPNYDPANNDVYDLYLDGGNFGGTV